MSDTMTINQIVQLGVETTAGSAPAGGSDKLLTGLNLKLDPDFGHTEYAASGHRFDTISVPTKEKSKLSGDGPMTYTEVLYPQSGVYGAATVTTPAGGRDARKHTQAPTLTGVVTGKTFQVQKGELGGTGQQVNYGQFTDFGFAASRAETKISVAGFAGRITDGATLTASPTSIELVPVEPNDWNIYLDLLAADIGTTQLTRCFAANFGYTGAYGDAWPMDRSQPSFATVANIKPSLAVSLMLMQDTSVLTPIWTAARAAGKVYIRYEAISKLLADNYQTLSVTGSPTGGSFTLTYKSQTTAAITFDSTGHHPTAAEVQTALEALSTIGVGNVSCSGGPLDSADIVITFTGALANDTTLLTSTDSLTGGSGPATALVQTTVPYSYTHDVCCQPAPDAYQDTEGLWTQMWNFMVVSDPNWTAGNASGTAIVTALVNNLTGL